MLALHVYDTLVLVQVKNWISRKSQGDGERYSLDAVCEGCFS